MATIRDLKPESVWKIFDDITRVPRPSKKEEQIIAFLLDFAKTHGIECRRDRVGNVVMKRGATPGMESRPTVILQSHMDMVCEKNSDVDFDFEKDAIRTRVDGEWVRAEGTTLGADCGIGMAAALAVLTDETVEHGPIEALFTVDEETGLTGAFELEENMISGRYLINLDSEDEGELFIGCAGGIDTVASLHYTEEPVPANYAFYRADISDLLGGHSGDDINKGRANSNKIIARLLLLAVQSFEARLSYFCGGNLRNAIPREAYAIFGVPSHLQREFEKRYETFADDVRAEYRYTEPNLRMALNPMPAPESVLDESSQNSLVYALVGVPDGVLAMSHAVDGLVETSTNLASVKFEKKGTVTITTSQRSSVESRKIYAMRQVEAVFSLAGAEVTHSDGYPGWAPNPDSLLLERCRESYVSLFGQEPKVKAIHAGLECGLFLEKYPDLDMVSFGPTLRGVHSPDERIEISTVMKFWQLLTDVLKRMD